MWRIEGRVRAASTKHKFAPHPSRPALGHLRQFGDDRSFNLGCHVGRRVHEQRRLPRSREDHSVNFAVPVHDKGFDRTLRLRQAVRINPMHHHHLSSVNEKIRSFSCAAAEAAEAAEVAGMQCQLLAEEAAAKLCLLLAAAAPETVLVVRQSVERN